MKFDLQIYKLTKCNKMTLREWARTTHFIAIRQAAGCCDCEHCWFALQHRRA